MFEEALGVVGSVRAANLVENHLVDLGGLADVDEAVFALAEGIEH